MGAVSASACVPTSKMAFLARGCHVDQSVLSKVTALHTKTALTTVASTHATKKFVHTIWIAILKTFVQQLLSVLSATTPQHASSGMSSRSRIYPRNRVKRSLGRSARLMTRRDLVRCAQQSLKKSVRLNTTPITRHAIAKVNAGKYQLLTDPFHQQMIVSLICMEPQKHLLKLMLLLMLLHMKCQAEALTFLNIHMNMMLLCMHMQSRPSFPRSLR